jgi:uncharacterized protein
MTTFPLTGAHQLRSELVLEDWPKGAISKFWVQISDDALGTPIAVPVLLARGAHPGPVVGVTAAIHGNELNGFQVIHQVLSKINPAELHGDFVGVPVLNVPGFLRCQREFSDGTDLNRIMPGKKDGNASQVYAYRILHRIIKRFQFLIDLHTASFGRVNSLYVRADLRHPATARMAFLQSPQIIVHNEGNDGTLRSEASELGIHAITVEVGNPLTFQRDLIRFSVHGILDVLSDLDMVSFPVPKMAAPVICSHSTWMYTEHGGVLEVLPPVTALVREQEPIARLRNVFGELIQDYLAPFDAIVVGRSTNPVAYAGARIAHIGVVGTPSFVDTEQRLLDFVPKP